MFPTDQVFSLVSMIFIALVLFVLLVCAVRFPGFFKIGLRSTRRRIPQAISLCIGGIIGTSAIGAALVTGDSLDQMVIDQSIAALGDIDTAVSSARFFDIQVYDELVADPNVQAEIDASAPIIVVAGTARNPTNKAVEGSINIHGIDNRFYDFGSFEQNDREVIPNLQPDQCVINKELADGLDISPGQTVTVRVTQPDPVDAFFLNQNDLELEMNLTVIDIYENKGLGALNLHSRDTTGSNLYLQLDQLQEALEVPSQINTVLISNNGDRIDGVQNDKKAKNALESKLSTTFGYEDAGYSYIMDEDRFVVVHEDVIFDPSWKKELDPDLVTSDVLTYFINSMEYGDEVISYSTFSGIDFKQDRAFGEFYSEGSVLDIDSLEPDELILNDWTADHLGVKPGDQVEINYTILDKSYRSSDHKLTFTIKAIFDMTGKATSEWLLPNLPGISEVETCSDWDPSFDIDLSQIEASDQDYWDLYAGSPKAYIDLDTARALFGNFQGNTTHIKILLDGKTAVQMANTLNATFDHEDYGLTVESVKSDQLATREGLWIFTGMFLTFGGIIVLAGAILMVNIFTGIGFGRKREIGILRSQGATRLEVGAAFFTEGAVYSIICSALGVLGGLGLGYVLVHALNTVWKASVESNPVVLSFQPATLVQIFALGLVISIFSVVFSVILVTRMKVIDAISDRSTGTKRNLRALSWTANIIILVGIIMMMRLLFDLSDWKENLEFVLMGPILIVFGQGLFRYSRKPTSFRPISISALLVSIWVVIFGIFFLEGGSITMMTLFALSGLSLVVSGFIAFSTNMKRIGRALSGYGAIARVGFSGITRKPGRVLLTMLSVALVVYLVTALSVIGSYQQRALENEIDNHSGGWDIQGTTTIPYDGNLGSEDAPYLDGVEVLQLRSVGQPGGSCSNMNIRYPPQILGVPEEFRLQSLVKFQDSEKALSDREIWENLDSDSEQIPIVVDYNTLVWVYGGNLGDVFTVEGDTGETFELKVTAIMAPSIYAGMFVMSTENIERVFPLSAKFTYFLFKTDDPNMKAIEIEANMWEYGMDAQPTYDLAKSNIEFEASYMTIFQGFLVIGLFIGSAGISVIVYRSAMERKYEIGVLRSLGMSKQEVAASLVVEASLISIAGIAIGTLSGLISAYLSFAVWGRAGFQFPVISVTVIPLGIFIITVIFSLIPAFSAASKPPVENLRRID